MSTIFAMAGLTASDYQFARQADNRLIYDAAVEFIAARVAQLTIAESVFIAGQTEKSKWRYQLPGGGRISRRATGTRGPVVKATGSWDVAFTLEDYGERVADDEVPLGYLTPAGFQSAIDTVLIRYVNERRHQILHRLLDDQGGSPATFIDLRLGSHSIQPLANGDSVTYPPVLGSTSEATDDHYNESGYVSSAISDTNNPYPTNVDEVLEHFGESTGGDNVVTFINNAEESVTRDLTDFDEIEDRFIRSGSNTDVPFGLPSVPGKIIGRTNSTWVSVWRHMPATYMLSIHLDVEAPLWERHDPAETGLPQGLTLVAQDEGTYDMLSWDWRGRFGFGVGNRLNGAVMEVANGGSYTVPTAFDSP